MFIKCYLMYKIGRFVEHNLVYCKILYMTSYI